MFYQPTDSRHMTRPALGIIVTITVAMLTLQACEEPAAKSPEQSALSVALAPARPVEGMTARRLVAGTFEPAELVYVKSELNGYVISELFVEEGQIVQRGQLIARLSSDRLRAEQEGVAAQVRQTQQALSRAETLFARNAGSEKERDDASAAYRQAISRQRALAIDLERTEIRAPVDGRVTKRRAEKGDITANSALFEIAAGDTLELVLDLSEAVWLQSAVGQAVEITSSDGSSISGSIVRLSGAADPRSRLHRAWVAFPIGNHRFVAGQPAEARVVLPPASGVLVPQTALQYDAQGTFVFVMEQGRARLRRVGVGPMTADWALIETGLRPGMQVVARAGSLLRNGDPIRSASSQNGAK
ncbi:efflux RND transporter periplasmic adaptor subunit [Shinella daejeonensis]|uniref:efflux RND transporter periplasmic adaptor subunit n=1 Tax=Shinella daejeonensis TaxID=659017 RepID=UPI0020C7ED2D|nr:efflux RND transporter periplasmic adaptor subunit [Shinella daejeonensis]